VFTEAGFPVERLSNGRLRIETTEESVNWILSLMRENRLPAAEIFSSPDALHGLFLKALAAAGHDANA
jgi:hypothetical protein